MKTLTKLIGSIVAGILTLAALVAAIYGVMYYIDSRIAAQLNEPSMVRRIALSARPEMIIDNKGRIEIDRGAMDYIADIKVTQNSKYPILADSIVITPRRYMAYPPLVTSVDAAILHTKAERGQKLDWIIKLEYGSWDTEGPNRLRIEIMDR